MQEAWSFAIFWTASTLLCTGVGALLGVRFIERKQADLGRTSLIGVSRLEESLDDANKAAQAAVERYRTLTENLAAAVVIRDEDSRVIYCSPYTEVLTGHPLAHIYAQSDDFFLSTVHEQDRDKMLRALKICAAGEPFHFQYRFYHASGIEMWAETRTVPIMGEHGEVASSLSITFDVTATVRYQQQVMERNRDLQDFTYMVSHDLKAPIFTIKGMIGILSEDCADKLQDEDRETLVHIKDAADRLERLVQSVLEYSRAASKSFDKVPVSLSEVVADVTRDHAALITTSEGMLDVPPDLPQVLGERLRLYQIFSNLIGNALKYRSEKRTPHVQISHSISTSGRHVTVEIRDNGRGIPNDKIEEVFRPFQRLASDVEGSGIGLACVKKLVERLGGQISAESVLDRGSVFRVTLPRTDATHTSHSTLKLESRI